MERTDDGGPGQCPVGPRDRYRPCPVVALLELRQDRRRVVRGSVVHDDPVRRRDRLLVQALGDPLEIARLRPHRADQCVRPDASRRRVTAGGSPFGVARRLGAIADGPVEILGRHPSIPHPRII